MLRFGQGKKEKRIKLQLLRQFALYYDQEKVSGMLSKSKMAKAFIAYLAMHRGEVVTFDEVYDTVALGKKSKEKNNSIKVLAFRTRTMLGSIDESLRECIESKPGGYSWNLAVSEVDVLELEALATELREVTVYSEDMRRKVRSFLTLYTPDILPEFGKEAWVQAYAQSLKMQALQAALHVLPLLEEAGEEGLAAELSDLLSIPRKDPEAQPQQAAGQGSFLPQTPVERMHPRDSAMEETLDEVELDLVAYQENEGALLCEYDTFRRVYEFQRRGLSKYRQSFYIAVIKLRLEDEHREGLWTVAEGMQWMGTVLKGMLSQSDTVARYAATQYVALIQEQEVEQVQRKLQGIQRRFSQGEGTEGLRVSCEYRKLPGYRPQSERMQQALRG